MISQNCPKCGSDRVRRGYRPTPFWSKLIFRYHLLCDNCNWEFVGFAVPGTVSVKPTRKQKKESEPVRDVNENLTALDLLYEENPLVNSNGISNNGNIKLNEPESSEIAGNGNSKSHEAIELNSETSDQSVEEISENAATANDAIEEGKINGSSKKKRKVKKKVKIRL